MTSSKHSLEILTSYVPLPFSLYNIVFVNITNMYVENHSRPCFNHWTQF